MTTPQQLLAKRYQMIRQLAAGSFAETWLATDIMLDRFVAIKVLHADDSRDPAEETEQFLREARIAAAVSHPNIVAIFDAGATNERPFLVMEWVDGASLKQEIVTSRRIPLERSISAIAELLDGLSAIHDQGIIHRDVKPQNIMVNELGTVKLTDFGIARLSGESDGSADGTTTGSAAYMAPEQAQGLPATPSSDVYAAGVILYEMLTGRLPFRHDDPQQVLIQHISEQVPRPRRINPAIPPQLEAIVLQALEKEPDRRFDSAHTMRDALLAARKHLPVRRPVVLEPAESSFSIPGIPRFAWMAASLAFILVLTAGATTIAVRDFGTSPTIAESVAPTPTAEATAEPEVEPTVEAVPTEVATPQWERREGLGYESDDDAIRGEIIVDSPRESGVGINRPAPSREATEDDLDDDEDSTDSQTAAAPAPPPPPPPTPTPEPEPTPTPVPTVEPSNSEDDGNDEAPSERDSNNGNSQPEQPGNSGTNNGSGNNQGNGNSQNGGSNQGNGEDDSPATNQNQQDDEDENASPQQQTDDAVDDEDAEDETYATAYHQDAGSDEIDEEKDKKKERRGSRSRADSASSDDDDSDSEKDDRDEADDDEEDEEEEDDEKKERRTARSTDRTLKAS
jgi:serine/threonine protein kinase